MTMTTKRAATRLALFLGAAAGAFALAAGAAGTAEAQNAELLADLTGTADACMAGGGPLLAEGAAVCSAELRLRFGGGKAEVRFGAETARALPAGIASNPRGKPGCVQASPATAQEPETWNCTGPTGDPYSQCVVELNVDTGDRGPLNEAACLLRTTVTFQVRDASNQVRFSDGGRTVECLADAGNNDRPTRGRASR